MVRKMLLVTLGCLFVSSAANAGGCRGGACRDLDFGKDANGCLEIRNRGRQDIEVTVYTTNTIPVTVSLASGATEKVYKTGRMCVPAVDYVRSDAAFSDGMMKGGRSTF